MDYRLVRESIRVRVESANDRARAALIRQLRSPLGVIPFLGAGISAPFNYRQWGEFLRGTAREQLGDAGRAAVDDAVAGDNYFRAAALLSAQLGKGDFQRLIAEEFSDDRLRHADLQAGALDYVPLLTAGPAITTNFDRVIEHAFARAGRPLETVYGANPEQVVAALQQNQRMLWKIHGDRDDPRTLVFSEAEYRKHYRVLPRLLSMAFLNRPALFLGCSLDKDRTTDVLQKVHQQHPATTHFAILQIPESDDEFEARTVALRRMGIRPLWYRQGEHQEIEQHLATIVHGMSAIRLQGAETRGPAPDAAAPGAAVRALAVELQQLEADPDVRVSGAPRPDDEALYLPMVERLGRGRLTFFLGAYACLGRLPLGSEFYDELVVKLGLAELTGSMEPRRIAQHYADKYGREALYLLVREKLGAMPPSPTAVHWFIATVCDRLRGREDEPSQVIFTTNYDDWMEHALEQAGVEYHLFTYRLDEPHAGRFVYRTPSGQVHVVDRPSHFRTLAGGGPVVVRLHGGLHRSIDLPISYAFIHRDFVELAGRLQHVLPHVVLEALQSRPLLFLGSGLGDDSIETLVRIVHAADAKRVSWAVQWRSRPERRSYWRELGLDIVDMRLEQFIIGLSRAFTAIPGAGS